MAAVQLGDRRHHGLGDLAGGLFDADELGVDLGHVVRLESGLGVSEDAFDILLVVWREVFAEFDKSSAMQLTVMTKEASDLAVKKPAKKK